MKNLSFLLAAFLMPLLTFNQSLNYVSSSVGLSNPDWEGGKSELEFADINMDGHVDFITIGDHGNPGVNTSQHGIMVYFGNGTGTWTVQMVGDFGYGGIAVGDVNNDGSLDVGYGMHHNYSSTDLGDQLIEVALGDGTGTSWIPWDDGLATNGEDWGMFGTDFADIDIDGDLDIGSISFGCCAGVHVYKNNFDGTWTQSYGFLNGNSFARFDFGDLNNDGYPDFTITHDAGAVYFGDGNGNFNPAGGNLPAPSYDGISIGDINNDGIKDIAFIKSGIEIWGWNPVQQLWVDYSGNLPAGSDYEATQLFDMNVDGFMDLAAFGNGQFTLWLGDGTGNWTQDAQFSTPQQGYCKAFRVGGDVDHNGFPDIILVAEEGTWINYQNFLYCFKENSIADNLTSFPVFPGGYEVFHQNSVQFIEWLSAVPGNVTSWITLEYSLNGVNGNWIMIAENVPNSGSYQWIVPQGNSTNCFIRITAHTATDQVIAVTPQPFTIIGDEVFTADFTADITYGEYPLTVQFTDLSSTGAISWEWDFNSDGMVDSYEQNPVWTYENAGIYTVTLTAGNGSVFSTTEKPDYIQVLHPALASFVADVTAGAAPLSVNFTSENPGSNIWWEWDFENDGVIDSYEENPQFIYQSPGSYSVKLRVGNGISEDIEIIENYIVVSVGTQLFNHEKFQNYVAVVPNPISNNGSISFYLNESSNITFSCYRCSGEFIFQSITQNYSQGLNSTPLNIAEMGIPKGLYLLKMQTDRGTRVLKFIVN